MLTKLPYYLFCYYFRDYITGMKVYASLQTIYQNTLVFFAELFNMDLENDVFI